MAEVFSSPVFKSTSKTSNGYNQSAVYRGQAGTYNGISQTFTNTKGQSVSVSQNNVGIVSSGVTRRGGGTSYSPAAAQQFIPPNLQQSSLQNPTQAAAPAPPPVQQSQSKLLSANISRRNMQEFYSNPENFKEAINDRGQPYTAVKSGWERANDWIAARTTKRVYNWAQSKGFTKPIAEGAGAANTYFQSGLLGFIPAFKNEQQKLNQFNVKFGSEYAKSYIDKPLTQAAFAGLGAAYSYITSAASVTAAGRNILKGLNIGLGLSGAALGVIGFAQAKDKTKFAAEFAAGSTSFAIGGFAGAKAYNAYEMSKPSKIDYKYSKFQYDYKLTGKGKLHGQPYEQNTIGSTLDKKSITTTKYKDYEQISFRDYAKGTERVYTKDLANGNNIKFPSKFTEMPIPKNDMLNFKRASSNTIREINSIVQTPNTLKSYAGSTSSKNSVFKSNYEKGKVKFNFELQQEQLAQQTTIATDQVIKKASFNQNAERELSLDFVKPEFTFSKTKPQKDIMIFTKTKSAVPNSEFYVRYPAGVEGIKVTQPRITQISKIITTETGKGTYVQEGFKLRPMGKKGELYLETPLSYKDLLPKPEVTIPAPKFSSGARLPEPVTPNYIPTSNKGFFSFVGFTPQIKSAVPQKPITLPQTKPITKPAAKVKTELDTLPKTDIRLEQIQQPQTRIITQTITLNSPKVDMPPIPPMEPGLVQIDVPPPFIPPIKLSPVLGGFKSYKRNKIIRLKSKRAYTPTFYSAGFGIKGKESKRLTMSGISIRPINISTKKKKKSKRLKI